jgi:hypothetical protein
MRRRNAKRRLGLVDIREREAAIDLEALKASARCLDWYALTVEAQKEFHASVILRRRGYTTFLPTRQDWRRRNRFVREKEPMTYPLIARCLLVGFRIEAVPPWFDLFQLSLVRGVIGFDGAPRTVPQISVIDLVDRFGANHFRAPDCQKWIRTHHEFSIGNAVEVVEGPFAGHRTKVRDIKGLRADVLLELFNSKQPVKIPLDHLELLR